MVALGITRNDGETWRECALRYATAHGLEWEVMQWYDSAVARGEDEASAALAACSEWDVVDLHD